MDNPGLAIAIIIALGAAARSEEHTSELQSRPTRRSSDLQTWLQCGLRMGLGNICRHSTSRNETPAQRARRSRASLFRVFATDGPCPVAQGKQWTILD